MAAPTRALAIALLATVSAAASSNCTCPPGDYSNYPAAPCGCLPCLKGRAKKKPSSS